MICLIWEICCPNRITRLAKLAGIKAQIGYNRWPGGYGGRPSGRCRHHAGPAQFDVETHDRVWRRIAGWCLQSRKTTDIVLQALLMACDADS